MSKCKQEYCIFPECDHVCGYIPQDRNRKYPVSYEQCRACLLEEDGKCYSTKEEFEKCKQEDEKRQKS